MVAISFSVFRDKLENGSKTQTIREWKPFKGKPKKPMHGRCCTCDKCGYNYDDCICREPRIKVGTSLQIYWKQRSKKVFECLGCKQELFSDDLYWDRGIQRCSNCGDMDFFQKDGSEKLFDTVCVETWLIEIQRNPHEEGSYLVKWGALYFTEKSREIEELAKRDGFEDGKMSAAENMFEWFDKKYDLTEPKVFQVIRWELSE